MCMAKDKLKLLAAWTTAFPSGSELDGSSSIVGKPLGLSKDDESVGSISQRNDDEWLIKLRAMLGEKVRRTRDADHVEYYARHDPPIRIDPTRDKEEMQTLVEPDSKTAHEVSQEPVTQDDPVMDRVPERDKEGTDSASIVDEDRKELISQGDPEVHRVPERDKNGGDDPIVDRVPDRDEGVDIAKSFFLDADKARAHFGEVVRILKE